MRGNQKGFTLVELMIVVAILSLLAAIAYPAYLRQVQKSRRAECETVLLSIAGALERKYAVDSEYPATLPAGSPTTCPLDGGTTFYNIGYALDGATGGFTLTAKPTSAQESDPCGDLSITHTGKKGQKTGATVDQCWR
jgi:type IV pilus assembly protein PilE